MAERGAAAVRIQAVARERAEVARHLGLVAQEVRVSAAPSGGRRPGRRRPRGSPTGGCRRSAARGAPAGAGSHRPAPSAGLRTRKSTEAISQSTSLHPRRLRGKALQAFRRRHPDRGGAVGERRGVAGGQRAFAAGAIEGGAEPGELLQRRVLARDVSRLRSPTGITRSSKKPRSQAATARGGWQSHLVLLGPADLPFLGGDLGVLAHAEPGRAVGDRGNVESDVLGRASPGRSFGRATAPAGTCAPSPTAAGRGRSGCGSCCRRRRPAPDCGSRRRSCRPPRSRRSCWSSRP
jgi:hypothetical protein